jgi:hypothetical protein
MTPEANAIQKKKILLGLVKNYEELLEYKKQKKTELVIIRDNKIVRIKP